MRKIEDYRRHADECLAMSRRARTDEERKMLQQMAETWSLLAHDREEQIARRERIKKLDDSMTRRDHKPNSNEPGPE